MQCKFCGKDAVGNRGGNRTICASCSVSKRRWKTKLELIEMMGGKCQMCGYDKHPAALQFHHLDPSKKEFTLNANVLLKKKLFILTELEKCILVCANCHASIHSEYERYRKVIEDEPRESLVKECPVCQKYIPQSFKYCSLECSHQDHRKVERPSLEILQKDIKEIGYVQTGKKYGVSDNCIRKWEKRYLKDILSQ